MRPIRRTFLALAALAGLAGCAKEQPAPGAGPDADGYVTLRATQETPGTRAIIGGADNKSIFWSEGDALSVFDAAGKNEKFNISGGAGTSSGTFRGLFESVPSTYVALHPYQAAVTLSSAEGAYRLGGVVLKSEQKAVAGSFDSAAALMTAQSADSALGFRNAVGFVKVKPEFDCSKITLVSKSSTDALAGTVELGLASDGTPSVSSVADASSKVSISGDIKANSTYYIAVLPVTLANGFRLIFTDSTGDRTKETDKSLEIGRSNVKNLGGFATDALDEIPYVTFSAEGAQKFAFTLPDYETAAAELGTFEYSVNGGEWIAVTSGEEIAFGGSAGTLRLRGISPKGTAVSEDYYSNISFSNDEVEVSCTGDIRTLIDWENYDSVGTGDARFCSLFEECSVLTSAPGLPATKLADGCYSYMFKFCTVLTEAPALPAETLADWCYSEMFYGCTKLTEAPALNAMNLADYCYANMFFGCSMLKNAPALPATTLAEGCYCEMFHGCTALKTAPVLPAAKLVLYCYMNMFYSCPSLNEVIIKVTDTDMSQQSNIELYALNYWLEGVASSGTIYMDDTFTNLPTNSSDGIPTGWNVKSLSEIPDDAPYVTFSAESEQGFSINGSTPLQQGTFEYSVGGGAWTAVVCGPEIAFGGSYGDLRLRGKSPEGTAVSDVDCSTITFSYEYVSVAASGDIRTLVDWENYSTVDTGNARFCWLFYENSMLTSAPELPATKLADCCYSEMFFNCSELTAAPKLPATVLADYCYRGMFENCESLGTAPALPATSLKKGCYSSMFRGCNSLEKAPELPAETLVDDCYSYMFTDCIYLDEITLKTKDASATDCLTGWVNDVAGLGTFHKYNSLTLPEGADGIPTGWTIVNHSDNDWNTIVESGGTSSGDSGHLTFKVSGAQTFGMTVASGLGLDGAGSYFEYSTDKGANWIKFTETVSGVSFSDELWLRGISPKGTSVGQNSGQYGIISFGNSGVKVAASGDIRSLVNCADYKNADTSDARFIGLFMGCQALTSTPDLQSTKLADQCYVWMFANCTSLTKVPDVLPATELAAYCYILMFAGCTSLETVQENMLPATDLSIVTPDYTAYAVDCYASMFANCTSLKNAPKLPATTLSGGCYTAMFRGCTSLTAAPELKVTEMQESCYSGMFGGCTSLTQAPALPATTLAYKCYENMFEGCTSLTEAPELPAEKLAEMCYEEMFRDCSSLQKITVKAKTNASQATQLWLTGVAGAGTIDKYLSFTPEVTPSGWTVVNHIDTDWDTIYDPTDTPYLSFTADQQVYYFGMTVPSSFAGKFQYSQDKGLSWTTINSSVSGLWLGGSVELWLRGTSEYGTSYNGESCQITLTPSMTTSVTVSCTGDIRALIDYSKYKTVVTRNASFAMLFKDCKYLSSVPSLPAKNLKESCYSEMFSGCTGLKTVPAGLLPATTLKASCYSGMFNGCTNLESAPALPATTLKASCYSNMFNGCQYLTSAPELSAAILAEKCYEAMFQSCYSLTEVHMKATDVSATDCLSNWLCDTDGGTIYSALDAETIIGASGKIEDWSVVRKY